MARGCTVRRCKRRLVVNDLCKTHARVKADRLFSALIRSVGKCAAKGEHLGYLQCAHIISRRYHNIRWDERNAVCLCARHHTYFTHHPVEWDVWVEDMFPGRLAELRPLALSGERVDIAEVLSALDELEEK